MSELENIVEKMKFYFDKEKFLCKSKFIEFLSSSNLLETFDLEEHREILWNQIMVFSNYSDQVSFVQCKDAIIHLFEISIRKTIHSNDEDMKNEDVLKIEQSDSDLIEKFISIESKCNEYILFLSKITKNIPSNFFENYQHNNEHEIFPNSENFIGSFDESNKIIQQMQSYISSLLNLSQKKGNLLNKIKVFMSNNKTLISVLQEENKMLLNTFNNRNSNEVEKKLIYAHYDLTTIVTDKEIEIDSLRNELVSKEKANCKLSHEIIELNCKVKDITEKLQLSNNNFTELNKNYDILLDKTFKIQEMIPIQEKPKTQNKLMEMDIFTSEEKNLIFSITDLDKEYTKRILNLDYKTLMINTTKLQNENQNLVKNQILIEKKLKEKVDFINKLENKISNLERELTIKTTEMNNNLDEPVSEISDSKNLSNLLRESNVSYNKYEETKYNKKLNDLRISEMNELNKINGKRIIKREDSINENATKILKSERCYPITENVSVLEFSSVIDMENKSLTPKRDINEINELTLTDKYYYKTEDNNISRNNFLDLENDNNEIILKNEIRSDEDMKIVSEFKINTDELQHTFSNKHKFTLSIDLRIHSNETNFLISPKNYNNLMNLENIILKEKDLINHSKNCLIEKKHDKINYNFLSLRKNVNFTKLLIEDYSLKVVDQIFSDKINIIDDHCKKFSKFIFITNKALYILRESTLFIDICYKLTNLRTLIISDSDDKIIVLKFSEGDDLIIHICRRKEFLHFFALFESINSGKFEIIVSDEFNVKRRNINTKFKIIKSSYYFAEKNYEDFIKRDEIHFWEKGLFRGKFVKKYIALANNGLLYFDDRVKPCTKIINIDGSLIYSILKKEYKRNYCFEILTKKKEKIVFAAKSEDEMNSWLSHFQKVQNKNEEFKYAD